MNYYEQSDACYDALSAFFRKTAHGWPIPCRTKPSFWDREGKRSEGRINVALATIGKPPVDQPFRDRFWCEVREGQIHEDANGYFWRCWCAAIVLPNEFLDRYAGIIRQ